MGRPDDSLIDLGRSIAAEQDELLRRRAPDPRRRERFVAAAGGAEARLPAEPLRWTRSSTRRAQSPAAAILVGLAAVIAASALLVVALGRRPLALEGGAGRAVEATAAPDMPAPAREADPAPPEPMPTASPTLPLPPPAVRPPRRAPAPSWRELVASGKYEEALAAADREGFRRICDEGSAADLRDLADAARLSGDAGRAAAALTTLRSRFAGGEPAAEAAFLLGIIAFDMRGAHAEAARWFSTYLDERPSGRLAREAAGRLIEARERAGDQAGAREAARRYLRDHPRGPHAEMARALVDE